ncbi:hypothetical protein AAC387_Pa07g3074 [Persea americana]
MPATATKQTSTPPSDSSSVDEPSMKSSPFLPTPAFRSLAPLSQDIMLFLCPTAPATLLKRSVHRSSDGPLYRVLNSFLDDSGCLSLFFRLSSVSSLPTFLVVALYVMGNSMCPIRLKV